MQSLPLQLVHEIFGEFLADAAKIEPSPDTFDFVLEACGGLADFYPDESQRQMWFNDHLEHYLGKPINRAKLTIGVSETDGSIVDRQSSLPEVIVDECRKPSKIRSCTASSMITRLHEGYRVPCILSLNYQRCFIYLKLTLSKQ